MQVLGLGPRVYEPWRSEQTKTAFVHINIDTDMHHIYSSYILYIYIYIYIYTYVHEYMFRKSCLCEQLKVCMNYSGHPKAQGLGLGAPQEGGGP